MAEQLHTYEKNPLTNFQEQDWKRLFTKDIADIVADCSYEDNNIRISYSPVNAEEFIRIRKITNLSADCVEKDLLINIVVENKNPDAEIKEIPYNNVPIATVPLYTSSGFYINGVPYGARSESTLAPGWYMTYNKMTDSGILEHRSKYGANITISYKASRFFVKMKNRIRGTAEAVDLWTWLKAMSGSERYSDLLNRLNRLDIFMQDYLTAQKLQSENSPVKGRYYEPSIEQCAEKVIKSYNKYISNDIDYVTFLQGMVFTNNQLNFETNRDVRFKKMCGFNAAIDKQLAQDVVLSKSQRIKKGTTLTAEDITRISRAGVSEIYIEHDHKKYKLFEVSISELPSMNEFIAAIYYFGLLISGIGKATDPDDFTNKTIKTVSTMIAEHIEKQLSYLTTRMLSNYTQSASSSLTKLFSMNDLRFINTRSLKDEIFGSSAYNMQDETNSIAAIQHSYKMTGPTGLGKNARSVKKSHFNRVCSFTTPESKHVGLNLSLTLGSQVKDGFVCYPVFKVEDGMRIKEEDAPVVLLNDTDETNKIIAPYGADLDTPSTCNNEEMIPNCRLNGEIISSARKEISYQDKGSMQSISPILLFVPSLNRNAGKRLTMAANAISQARQPILRRRPWLATGIEAILKVNNQTARDLLEIALTDLNLDVALIQPTTRIKLMEINNSFKNEQSESLSYGTELVFNTNIHEMDRFTYVISRLQPATNNSIKHQRVRFVEGNSYGVEDIVVTNNDVDDREYTLAKSELHMGKDTVSSDKLRDSSMAFGDNVNVMFRSYSGYGYEDSIIVNERYAKQYGLTVASIIKIKDQAINELGPDGRPIKSEMFTYAVDARNSGETAKYMHLEGDGLAKLDERLKPGQIAINKRSTSSGRTLSRPTVLTIGQSGTVINKFLLKGSKGQNKEVTTANVILGDIEPLSQGDKVGGLHGNKGVVGKIVSDSEMPFSKFGTPDIIVNPLGVISRTNIGQLIEALMAKTGEASNTIQFLEPFSEMPISEMIANASKYGIEEVDVYDGRTGQLYERKAFMGNMYFLRSSHTSTSKHNVCGLTDAKRNAISLQPIKCNGGGQRIGELLANAFRAHNATVTLDSFFTTQSDDTTSCKELVRNIESGHPMEPVTGNYTNSELFLAFFRVLGLNINKDLQNKGENKFMPLTDEDIDILSLNKITTDMISASSKQSSADLFLRDTKFLKEYSSQGQMEDLKRTVYSSLELPKKVIMPLICYGDAFLNMFTVQVGKELKLMSTVLFKKVLMSSYILKDKNFTTYPVIVKRRDLEKDGGLNADCLFGVNALMCIFEKYNLNYTVAILESQLGLATPDKQYKGTIGLDIQDIKFDSEVEEDKDDLNVTDPNLIRAAMRAAGTDMDDFKEGADDITEEDNAILAHASATPDELNPIESDTEDELESEDEVNDEPDAEDAQKDSILDSNDELNAGIEGLSKTAGGETKREKISGSQSNAKLLKIRGNVINFIETQDINKYFVKHILIPPIAYRPDFDEHIASPVDKQLVSLIGKLKSYGTNQSDINLTNIYRELFWMVVRNPKMKPGNKNVFEMIVSHENRNSKVRDTLYAKRVLASGRSVIIVNPKLRLGQCRVPFSIAWVILKVVLLSERETKFPVLTSNKISAGKLDMSKKTYEALFDMLSNNNIREFASMLGINNKNYMEIDRIFTSCRNELKNRINVMFKTYPVLLNREPSLHKFNIMSFEGQVTDGYAIELHPLACRPYNADFDGDQMAVFMPYTEDAIRESKEKLDQRNNLINPNNGELIVELNQDMILGLYWLTMLKSNSKRLEEQKISKVYSVNLSSLTKSGIDLIKEDLRNGVINTKSVIVFICQGKKCIARAGDAEFGMVGDVINQTYTDCNELIGSSRLPADVQVDREYLDKVVTEADAFNNFDDYKNSVVQEVWNDVEMGNITPQDCIILQINDRRYKATAGRILLNSLLPDGFGFTQELDPNIHSAQGENTSRFYSLKFNMTVDSKNIKSITSFLQLNTTMCTEASVAENPEMSETQLFSENNIKFCEVLDRLKDVGFLMADNSGISISVFDFHKLELTRKNFSIAKALTDRIDQLQQIEDVEEMLQAIQTTLEPLNSMLEIVSSAKFTISRNIDYPYATCEEDVLINLNDQLKTPYDYVYFKSEQGLALRTLAQCRFIEVLEDTSLKFPLSISDIMNSLRSSGSRIKINSRCTKLIQMLADVFSKNGSDMQQMVSASIDELTATSGINKMKHRLAVVARKFKEGRLTEQRKQELTQTITGEYKKLVETDISQALNASRNSNLFIMVNSGARGNMNQLMEVCGVIGTVADGDGKPVNTPIESNLLTGLNSTELFTSSLHARSIIVNTQMDIPVSGTLNRKLSNLTEYIKIRPEEVPEEIFCGAESIPMPMHWEPKIPADTSKIYLGDTAGLPTDAMWERFVTKYFDTHPTFNLTSAAVEFTQEYIKKLEEEDEQGSADESSGDSTDKETAKLSNHHLSILDSSTGFTHSCASEDLKVGMDLIIRGSTGFARAFQNQFVSVCLIDDSVKELLSEDSIMSIVTEKKKIKNIRYKADGTSISSVFYRCLDINKVPLEIQALAEQHCYKKYDPDHPKMLIGYVITQQFIGALEANCLYVKSLPIYTIINCKCTTGVCRRCYGMKYDTSIMPTPSELIGFQGVQAICSTLSQMILDIHKSTDGNAAQAEIGRIDEIISSEVKLATRLNVDIGNLQAKIQKDTEGSSSLTFVMDAVDRHLHSSPLNLILEDTHLVAKMLGKEPEVQTAQAVDLSLLQDAKMVLSRFGQSSKQDMTWEQTQEKLKNIIAFLGRRTALSKCIAASSNEFVRDFKFGAWEIPQLSKQVFIQRLKRSTEVELLKIDLMSINALSAQALMDSTLTNLTAAISSNIDRLSPDSEASDVEALTAKVSDELLSSVMDLWNSQYKQGLETSLAVINEAIDELPQTLSRNNFDSLITQLRQTLSPEISEIASAGDSADIGAERRKELYAWVMSNVKPDKLTAYLRLSVWMDLIDLLKKKSVFARNLEMFPKSLIDCGEALEDKIVDTHVFSTGCIYQLADLNAYDVKYNPIKLSSTDALHYNGQIYSDAFLANTRQNIVTHVIRGDNDRNSPIGQMITGYNPVITVKPYDLTRVSTGEISDINSMEETTLFQDFSTEYAAGDWTSDEDDSFEETKSFTDDEDTLGDQFDAPIVETPEPQETNLFDADSKALDESSGDQYFVTADDMEGYTETSVFGAVVEEAQASSQSEEIAEVKTEPGEGELGAETPDITDLFAEETQRALARQNKALQKEAAMRDLLKASEETEEHSDVEVSQRELFEESENFNTGNEPAV